MTTTDARSGAIEALAGRIFSSGVGAAELCTAYLGIHLGFYRSLADSLASSAALAERTGCDERYVREWLMAQAVAGLLTVAGSEPACAEFALAGGAYEVLVNETSPAYLGGLADIVAAAGRVLPQLADAYRTGAGVQPAPAAERPDQQGIPLCQRGPCTLRAHRSVLRLGPGPAGALGCRVRVGRDLTSCGPI